MEAKYFRQKALDNLTGNWALSVGIAALAALLGGLIEGASFLPELKASVPVQLPLLEDWNDLLQAGMIMGNITLSFPAGISGLAAFILGGVLQLGYARFLLRQYDGKETNINDLFSRFDRFGQGFAQLFLRQLYVFLWTLLFIIPGLIKIYSYAMTPFLMEDHPELSASQAIDCSRALMDGHKWELFWLDLTFLGWVILAVLTANLGHLALNPYRNAAYAAFYRQLHPKGTMLYRAE